MNRADPREALVVAQVHVDDLALARGASWAEIVRRVEAIAEAAEGAGACLSFRFRERSAREAAQRGAHNLLSRLEGRGHEVGTRAHGRRLPEAKAAVDACGVANLGVSPGLVYGDPGVLLSECARLGFAWITDGPTDRTWSFAGWVPWRPGRGWRPLGVPLGPLALEPSVDPSAWGLLVRNEDAVRPRQPLDGSCFAALADLAADHARRPVPEGCPRVLLFTLADQNLCAAGSTSLDPAALDAFGAFLAGRRVVPAGEAAAQSPTSVPAPPRRTAQTGAIREAPLPHVPPLVRRVRRRLAHAGTDQAFAVARSGWPLHATWTGPDAPTGVLLLSHGGPSGGTRLGLEPFGLDPGRWIAAGLALVAWDRSGTGWSGGSVPSTPGHPAHVQDFQAVYDAVAARAPAVPIGILSHSTGILAPLYGDRLLAFLVDGESPADRWTLLHPAHAGFDLAAYSLTDDPAWEGREPLAAVGRLRCPYHRLQAEIDHAQGRLDLHARLMVAAARRGGVPRVECNGRPDVRPLPGRLDAHGSAIGHWILEAFERTGPWPPAP
ncbi:MAG: hypothetical protein JXB39_03465 [Deltaproteobacteria bacterium]|nr:hypothetical protein [Deltaproteobacteria bacterium]